MPLMPPRQAAAGVLLWIDSDTKFLLQGGQDAAALPGPTRSLLEGATRGEAVNSQRLWCMTARRLAPLVNAWISKRGAPAACRVRPCG